MENLEGDIMTTPEQKTVSEGSDEMSITPFLSLEEKLEEQWGEGLPYAPEGWPNADDKWEWSVGKGRSLSGYWTDRCLILPKSLQQGTATIYFRSRNAVKRYLRENFPEVNLKMFFDSFQWKIPCSAARESLQQGAAFQTRSKRRLSESTDDCKRNPVKRAGKDFSGKPYFCRPISMDCEGKETVIDFQYLQSLPSDLRAIVVENAIYKTLERLRESQQSEYDILYQKLFSQKEFICRNLDCIEAAQDHVIFQPLLDVAAKLSKRG